MSGPPHAHVADKTASFEPIGGDAKHCGLPRVSNYIPRRNSAEKQTHGLALPTSRTLRLLWVDDSARLGHDGADIASHRMLADADGDFFSDRVST